MAAYAALVSLMTTLNNIQTHPQVSTFFHHQQIQSLHEIINFLLEFMESINSHGGSRSREEEALERRIACTTHAAEDAIESHVVDQILADARDEAQQKKFGRFRRQVMINDAWPTRYEVLAHCLLDLENEIEDMNSVKGTVMEFRRTMEFKDEQSSTLVFTASSKPANTKMNFVVGFDEKLIQVMDRLTGYQRDLQIVPIVGMGGIGKTTLARSVYDNLLIVESFDIRAWVTISQEYSLKYVLSEILSCMKDQTIDEEIKSVDCEPNIEYEDYKLGLKLYQTLWGRRYLIILDDMWSLEAWDKIKFFFPNNDDRSRVVITTRIWSVATPLSSSSFEMNFLDEDQSWKLFCVNVFVEKGCPPELKEIGKEIVRDCKGLPLSIVVIGGLLRNSKCTRKYWEKFARDLNSILMSGRDELCFKIICLSYDHLPAHLKPCFLYMGVFKEDVKIRVSPLINLFVAESFLKPKEGHNFEEVAEDYFNDLVDRNLILVDSWKWNGRIKYCKMHDLVREVCIKIGERESIFHGASNLKIPKNINTVRHIVFHGKMPRKKKNWPKVLCDLPSARTFLYDGGPLPFKSRLLRVLTRVDFEFLEDIFRHVNLRYLNWSMNQYAVHPKFPSSISLLWNVHTLISDGRMEAPAEIWYMRQLRHLQIHKLFLPDPPPPSDKVEQQDDVLLPNLRTLSMLSNFSFTEEVCKRIPNIMKLCLGEDYCQEKCCYYLGHLHKLQSLHCSFSVPKRSEFLQSLVFPSSLRKLSLDNCHLHWKDLNTFGHLLPHLEFLKLYPDAIIGPEWDCVEGAFPRLKILHILLADLIRWNAEDSDFFPVLEQLHLEYLRKLERIPSGIGEIQTLVNLRVHKCGVPVAISSIEILEEQLNLGNDDLQVAVEAYGPVEKTTIMEKVDRLSFATKNLQFR